MQTAEYAIVQETDLQHLQRKVNAMAREGWMIQQSYGIPDHRGASHVVWMYRFESAPAPAPVVSAHAEGAD